MWKTYSTTFCLFSCLCTELALGNKEMFSYLCCLQSRYSCLLSQNPLTIQGFTENSPLLSPYTVKCKLLGVCTVPFQFTAGVRISERLLIAQSIMSKVLSCISYINDR